MLLLRMREYLAFDDDLPPSIVVALIRPRTMYYCICLAASCVALDLRRALVGLPMLRYMLGIGFSHDRGRVRSCRVSDGSGPKQTNKQSRVPRQLWFCSSCTLAMGITPYGVLRTRAAEHRMG